MEEQRAEIDHILGTAVDWNGAKRGVLFKTAIGDLDQASERARVLELLADMSNRFVNAFRSRLEAIADVE